MLTYKTQIESTKPRCKKGLPALNAMASKSIEQQHLFLLYQSVILSVTDYGLGLATLAHTHTHTHTHTRARARARTHAARTHAHRVLTLTATSQHGKSGGCDGAGKSWKILRLAGLCGATAPTTHPSVRSGEVNVMVVSFVKVTDEVSVSLKASGESRSAGMTGT